MMRTECAHAIRMLAADAIEQAQSGHPGMPLGMADIAEVLWREHLQHNPNDPTWLNRDRFVLSNGHGSMLLYALLHLTGYDVSLEDLKAFRTLNSKTPGHPEWGHTPGVESTSGPLGQGLAHAVGMAVAERMLSERFNRPGFDIIDHHTYVFVGDGCLMEGISHEVCSLAGTWGLGKLIVIWDDNGISIDGDTDPWFGERTEQRFNAYGWQVIENVDGHNPLSINDAIVAAQQDTSRPTLIAARTVIGQGAKQAGSAALHGAPLGAKGIEQLRHNLKWPHRPFEIPQHIYKAWCPNDQAWQNWHHLWTDYQTQYPDLAQTLLTAQKGNLPNHWDGLWQGIFSEIDQEKGAMATRKASLWCLNRLGEQLPNLVGGSADLTPSNLTQWVGAKAWPQHKQGRYLHAGVREFGLFAIQNGMALHGGFIPFSGTFLVFADYGKNAIRMAALMQTQSIFVLTHDSIGLGKDGPTHQPVEQLAMLRATPGLQTWRPASLRETAVAWQQALMHKGPSCLILSRQSVQPFKAPSNRSNLERGAEIIIDAAQPKALILATGSEVPLAIEAAQNLAQKGITVRVVSMPCMERFRQQDDAFKEAMLPLHLRHKTVVVEAGSPQPWYEWIAPGGRIIGVDAFGASAPANLLYPMFHLTCEQIQASVEAILKGENT